MTCGRVDAQKKKSIFFSKWGFEVEHFRCQNQTFPHLWTFPQYCVDAGFQKKNRKIFQNGDLRRALNIADYNCECNA